MEALYYTCLISQVVLLLVEYFYLLNLLIAHFGWKRQPNGLIVKKKKKKDWNVRDCKSP